MSMWRWLGTIARPLIRSSRMPREQTSVSHGLGSIPPSRAAASLLAQRRKGSAAVESREKRSRLDQAATHSESRLRVHAIVLRSTRDDVAALRKNKGLQVTTKHETAKRKPDEESREHPSASVSCRCILHSLLSCICVWSRLCSDEGEGGGVRQARLLISAVTLLASFSSACRWLMDSARQEQVR